MKNITKSSLLSLILLVNTSLQAQSKTIALPINVGREFVGFPNKSILPYEHIRFGRMYLEEKEQEIEINLQYINLIELPTGININAWKTWRIRKGNYAPLTTDKPESEKNYPKNNKKK